jgi:hypothetical protein
MTPELTLIVDRINLVVAQQHAQNLAILARLAADLAVIVTTAAVTANLIARRS